MQYGTNHLTPKQITCLALVAEGMTSKEIARSLGLSARTVDDHVEKARIKLDAPTRQRAAAIFRSLQSGQEPPAPLQTTPYQLRREPQAVDKPADAEPISTSTSRLNDGGIAPFTHFPDVTTSAPAIVQPIASHRPPSSALTIIMQILATAAAIALIALAYPQLAKGAEAISAFILKTTSRDRGAAAPH